MRVAHHMPHDASRASIVVRALLEAGRLEEAVPVLLEALQLEPQDPTLQLHKLVLDLRRGDVAGASQRGPELVARLSSTHPRAELTIEAMVTCAAALQAANQLTPAIDMGRRAYDLSREEWGENHINTVRAAVSLSRLLISTAEPDRQELAYREALDIALAAERGAERCLSKDHVDSARAAVAVGNALVWTNALEAGEVKLQATRDQLEASGRKGSPAWRECVEKHTFALLYIADRHRQGGALDQAHAALTVASPYLLALPRDVRGFWHGMRGMVLKSQERWHEAEAEFDTIYLGLQETIAICRHELDRQALIVHSATIVTRGLECAERMGDETVLKKWRGRQK